MMAGLPGRRRTTAMPDLAPADLLLVRAALGAGAGPTEALSEIDHPFIRQVVAQLRAGSSLRAVVAESSSGEAAGGSGGTSGFGGTSGSSGTSGAGGGLSAAITLLRVLALAEAVGTSAVGAVDTVVGSVRDQARLQRTIRTRAAAAVASARFLVALPVLGGVGMVVIDPNVRRQVVSVPGLLVLGLAALLIGLAIVWIRRLIAAVPAASGAVDPLVADRPSRGPVWGAAATVAFVGTILGGLLVGLAGAGAMVVVGPRLLSRATRARPAGPDEDGSPTGVGQIDVDQVWWTPVDRSAAVDLPTVQVIELLALAMSAGLGLAPACRLAGDVGPAAVRPTMHLVANRLGAGMSVTDALPAPLIDLARLIDLSHRWGAPTAEALRTLAADLRGRAASAAEEAAEGLTVRLVFPTTLLLVPAFGLLVIAPLVVSMFSGLDLSLRL